MSKRYKSLKVNNYFQTDERKTPETASHTKGTKI